MYDYFTEHLVKKRKTAAVFAVMFLTVIAGALLTAAAFLSGLLFVQLIGQLATIAVVALWWGVYFVVTSRNIEFEYIVTNGELDIDKIIGKRKRKRIISVSHKEIEIITPAGQYTGNADKVIDVSSNTHSDEKYVLVTSKDGNRVKIIFNPSEKMLKIFKVFCQRKVNWGEEK